MKMPNKAILDGDIIIYRAAFWADIEGIDSLEDRLKDDILRWSPDPDMEIVVAFSDSRKNNFRRDHWPYYKANRDEVARPESLDISREVIFDYCTPLMEDRLEADDLLGMAASSGEAVAVTVDKDLRGVPGWHWNPDKEFGPQYITPEDAHEFFCIQWMTGDRIDGLPGLWRVGPKKAKKFLDSLDREDWESSIIERYMEETRPEGKEVDMDPQDFALAMARCIRILHNGEYDPETKDLNLYDFSQFIKLG